MFIEAAAGLLDGDSPEVAITREATEELGITPAVVQHVFDLYMSPGSVTERVHFYVAPYNAVEVVGVGGGLAEEGEDIEILTLDFDDALAMTADGRIADGKTVILLQWAALNLF
jgi:nudix-type nucleoside diphosphatase (YffH/AdpP family)